MSPGILRGLAQARAIFKCLPVTPVPGVTYGRMDAQCIYRFRTDNIHRAHRTGPYTTVGPWPRSKSC